MIRLALICLLLVSCKTTQQNEMTLQQGYVIQMSKEISQLDNSHFTPYEIQNKEKIDASLNRWLVFFNQQNYELSELKTYLLSRSDVITVMTLEAYEAKQNSSKSSNYKRKTESRQ